MTVVLTEQACAVDPTVRTDQHVPTHHETIYQPLRCTSKEQPGRYHPLFLPAPTSLIDQVCMPPTNYQLPNGPVKAGRRWRQRHPQGANLGSNGILKFLSKTHTISSMHACTSDPYIPPITVARHAGDPLNPVSHSIWLCHDHSVTISPSNAGGHTQTK